MAHPCPKCNRNLPSSGQLTLSDRSTALTYECPECMVETTEFGEPIEIPLVFAVMADGRIIDPARPQSPPFWLNN